MCKICRKQYVGQVVELISFAVDGVIIKVMTETI